MFNDLKIILINDNEILAFNDIVAGIFSTYRSTSNNAIHQKEDRGLTEEETEIFLDELDANGSEFEGDPTEVDKILDKIIKCYPEVKYIIHGLKLAEAAKRTPQQAKKDKKLLNEKMKAKEAEREKRKAREEARKTPKKELTKEPEKEPTKEPIKETEKESGVKLLDDSDAGDKAKEKWGEERKNWQTPQEKDLSKVGKDKENYTGYKGVLFNIFKNLADPAKKADKEKLRKRLKRDWATYKKNEKLLSENKELIDALEDKIVNDEITPENVLLMNELIYRNPDLIKDIDFDTNIAKYDIQVPVSTLIEYKVIKEDEDDATIIKKIQEWAKKNKWDLEKMTLTTDVKGRKAVNYRAKDLNTFVEIAHSTGGDIETRKAG